VNDEEIYRKHREDLVRYAAALVGPGGAEDVVSTVVVRILARRRLADLDDPRPYLFRAMLNEARTRLKRRRPHLLVDDVADTEAGEQMDEVLAAVLALPARQRAATFLVYWAGMSVAEVATLMGVRPSTAKRYLHLARLELRGVLHEH